METRTRAHVIDELSRKLHEAGRMTVADADYGALHEEINALLTELEGFAQS